MKKIYFGDFNNYKSEELKSKMIDDLRENRGDDFICIFPNGELLKRYRREFIDILGSTFFINLYTFDDIVNISLEGSSEEVIDRPLQYLIIKDLIKELNLEYFKDVKDKDGYYHWVIDIISHIKKSLISPSEYLSKCEDNKKFKEIGLIYGAYEEKLKRLKLIDRESSYLQATSNFPSFKYVIIDKFYDFRPIEILLIEKIMEKADEVYINIPFNMSKKQIVSWNTLEKLVNMGFELEYSNVEDKGLFENISFNLFDNKPVRIDCKNKVKIVEADNEDLEIKYILREINKFKESIPYSKMGIVVNSDNYREKLYEIAKNEGVPLNISRREKLIGQNLSLDILDLIKIKVDNGNKESIISRLNSNFFKIGAEETLNLCDYKLRNEKFKDLEDLLKMLRGSQTINIDNLQVVTSLISKLEREISEIEEKNTIINFNRYIISKIEEYEVRNQILNLYKKNGNEEILTRNVNNLNAIEGSLKSLEVYEMEGEISVEDYYSLLRLTFSESFIYRELENLKAVNIYSPENFRDNNNKLVFMIGLNSDKYPSLDMNNYFFEEGNMKELKNMGVYIKNYEERLSNEEIKFSNNISNTGELLYLSYNRGYEGNKLSSRFLQDFLSIIDNDTVDKIKVDLNFFDSEILAGENRENLEIRGGLKVETPKKYSISYLEEYIRCPYSFMLNRLLNVGKMNRSHEDFSPLDLGNLYHETLKKYYQDFKYDIEGNLDKLWDILKVEALALGYKLEDKKNELIVEEAYEKLKNTIKNDYENINSKELEPYQFELDFEMDNLVGRIDRIDKKTGEDKYIVVDYKTSGYNIRSIDDMKIGLSLQLPVYIMSQKNKNIIGAAYHIINTGKRDYKIGLKDEKLITARSKGHISREDLGELLEETRKHIKKIIKHIEDGVFTVSPLECSEYCIYKDICRYEDKEKEYGIK